MYVYREAGQERWEVGEVRGKWVVESWWYSREEAALRVSWLNGVTCLRRFLLFGGYSQPLMCGGWGDWMGSFDTVEEALAQAKEDAPLGWYHVVDLATGERVEELACTS